MLAPRSILCLALLALAAPAAGVELQTEFRVGTGWNERSDTPSEDPSFLVNPSMRLKDERGELVYDVLYTPIWEYFLDDRGVQGWSHDVRGNATWNPTRRTSIRVSDRFLRAQDTQLFNELVGLPTDPDISGDAAVQVGVTDRRTKSNFFTGSLTHRLAGTWSLTFDGQHTWIEEAMRRETNLFSLSPGLDHALSERNTVGASLSFTRQTTEPFGGESRSTDYLGLLGRWTHAFDPTMNLRMRVGPTLVMEDPLPDPPTSFPGRPLFPLIQDEDGFRPIDVDSCPTFSDGTPYLDGTCTGAGAALTPASASLFRSQVGELLLIGDVTDPDNSSVTYFADVTLTKEWEDVDLTLSYRRSASTAASFGSSTIDDILNASVLWKPAQRWSLTFSGFYRHQSLDNQGRAFVTVLRELPAGEPTTVQLGEVVVPVTFNRDVAEAVGVRTIEVQNDLTSDTFVFRFSLGYQIRERIRIVGTSYFSYDELATGGSRHEMSFNLGLTYIFDPIQL